MYYIYESKITIFVLQAAANLIYFTLPHGYSWTSGSRTSLKIT